MGSTQKTAVSAKLTPRKLARLSFVIPVYNEEEALPLLRRALENWRSSMSGFETEIVLVDDGSRDASYVFCREWAGECAWVKVVSFSRNFGQQAAMTAGLQYAGGDAVVIIDADLQDPLEVITEMIRRYEEGYDVVYGQRTKRHGETRFKTGTAWLFYRLMRSCVYKDLPVNAGDFRLVSRQCVDALNAMPEAHRFLRGMFAWAGFSQIGVPYVRNERTVGETKWPLHKLLSLTWSAITSFSIFPIRIVGVFGVLTAVFGGVMCLYILWSYILGAAIRGWTSMMGLLTFIGGMLMISIAIIGEYVGKIYEEVKNRPLYLVQHTCNIDSNIKNE